jgi:hypothetical protein
VFLSNKNMIKIGDLGVAKLLAATRCAATAPIVFSAWLTRHPPV